MVLRGVKSLLGWQLRKARREPLFKSRPRAMESQSNALREPLESLGGVEWQLEKTLRVVKWLLGTALRGVESQRDTVLRGLAWPLGTALRGVAVMRIVEPTSTETRLQRMCRKAFSSHITRPAPSVQQPMRLIQARPRSKGFCDSGTPIVVSHV